MFRMKKQEYKEQERHYYFFDYLFWLGEITWEHYHKVSFNIPAFPAESGHAALCGTQVQSLPAQPVLFPSLFASYSRNGFIRNCSEMDN